MPEYVVNKISFIKLTFSCPMILYGVRRLSASLCHFQHLKGANSMAVSGLGGRKALLGGLFLSFLA